MFQRPFLFILLFLILYLPVKLTGGAEFHLSSPKDNDHLLLGNPSNATTSLAYETNYLMRKDAFCLSYNSKRGIPNWVSWHLDDNDFGNAKRSNSFKPDMDLPDNWFKATSSSYKNSGFDRGHNCPSADRTGSSAMNLSTFLMSNIIPQAPNNNQGIWANLEEYCRNFVRDGNELYIIMGSYGKGGVGANGYVQTIDNDRVTVPNRIWKVVLGIKKGNNDFSRINKGALIIAIDVPNSNKVHPDWRKYLTTIDKIEQQTGLNLFNNLSFEVQDILESKISAPQWD